MGEKVSTKNSKGTSKPKSYDILLSNYYNSLGKKKRITLTGLWQGNPNDLFLYPVNNFLHQFQKEKGKTLARACLNAVLFIFVWMTQCGSKAVQLIQCVSVQEDGVNLLTVIKGTCKYRHSRRHDFVKDFLPPSRSEFKQTLADNR